LRTQITVEWIINRNGYSDLLATWCEGAQVKEIDLTILRVAIHEKNKRRERKREKDRIWFLFPEGLGKTLNAVGEC
jgi:hypothetical protein